MPPTRRHCAAVAALNLVLLLVPVTERAASSEPPAVPGVRDSAELSSPVVIRGHLTRAGRRTEGTIALLAQPADGVLAAGGPGTRYKLLPLAAQRVDPSGRFDLRPDPVVPLDAAGEDTPHGRLYNLTLLAYADGRQVVNVFPRILRHTAAGDRWEDAAVAWDDEAAKAEQARGQGSGAQRSTPRSQAVREAAGGDVVVDVDHGTPATARRAAPDPVVSKFPFPCFMDELNGNLDPRWSVVGAAWTGPGSTATLTYGEGASSTLGVGVATMDDPVEFHAEGEKRTSATAELGFAPIGERSGVYFDSSFQYEAFRHSCPGFWPFSFEWRTIEPVGWAGGERVRGGIEPPEANYCVPQRPGSHFTKTETEAVTWSNGVDLKFTFVGIDLSIQTGFSTEASLRFDFQADGELCGTANWPASDSRQLVSKGPWAVPA